MALGAHNTSKPAPIGGMVLCDLMEIVEGKLSPMGHELPITLKPYEILTICVGFSSFTGNEALIIPS